MLQQQEDTTDPKTTVTLFNKDEEKIANKTEVLAGAQHAVDSEHAMGLFEGIRKYPKAVLWSFCFSSALIMEGFDHAFISGFFAFPAFQRRYGVLEKSGDYQIPADIQAGISNGVFAGEIIGLILNGIFADRFGYRWIMIISLLFMICFIFLQFFATSIAMYLGAEILLGLPWGIFQTLTTTYAAEVCPNVLRPYLTMMVSLCWSIGYLVGTAVLRGFLSMDGEWAYRIPFALQWVFPIPLVVAIYFAPESPWWLVRRGRIDEAHKALQKLRSKDSSEDEITDTVALMEYTVKVEEEMQASSSYLALFKKTDFRRTEIAVCAYMVQGFVTPLFSYVVYFLEQAGLPTTDSFDFGVGEYALAILGVFVAWALTPKVGRRTLMLWGTSFVTLTTFVIGFMGLADTSRKGIAYGIGVILLIQYFVFFFTVGPVVYTIVTEIPSNSLRTKTVVLARAMYNVHGLVDGQLLTRMFQNAAWGWGAKSAFYWGGWMLLILVWTYYRLPETKNRTFAEVDILFRRNVKARDFKDTTVDLATESTVKN